MTDEIAKILSESGCIEIGFGAESGSQKILDTINKRVKVEQNYKFVETCNKFGIKVKAFVLIGLPGEDMETIKETKAFIDYLTKTPYMNRFGKLITNDFDVTIYFPYKGTKIRDSIDQGERIYDLSLINNPDSQLGFYKGKNGASEISVRTSGLSSEQLVEIQHSIQAEFKSRVLL
jgi:radical SAM superfamily enzyme YgiQ (UPF0313 family)